MLTFTKMTVTNVGPYKGEQTIDFKDGKGVTFIWGENGHGKTTLLNLFRYALFGHFLNRHGASIDIPKMVNLDGIEDGNFGIKVVLYMDNDGDHYELTRQYTLREGVTVPHRNDDYVQDTFLNVNGSILSGAARDHVLKMIMPEDVSRFFLFDGELLQEYEELLTEGTNVGESIKKAIETILGVPILTNGTIDTEVALTEQRKEQNRVAQSNTTTERLAAKIEAETATMQEQKDELDRLQAELDGYLDQKVRYENEGKQNEHVKSLISEMHFVEGDIADKEAKRDTGLQAIIVQTKDAWKGLLSKQAEKILQQVNNELHSLEQKKASQDSVTRLLEYMKRAIDLGECECCGQTVDEDHKDSIRSRISERDSQIIGLTEAEVDRIRELRTRQTSLSSMIVSSNMEVIRVLEEQTNTLTVEIDQAKQRLKEIRNELSRYGQIEDLTQRDREVTNGLADCLQKIDNTKDGIIKTKEKIKAAETAIATLNDKIRRTATTDTDLQLAIKKAELCEGIHAIFEEGIAAYRDKLKHDVERDATELFLLICSDPDYTSLKINENYGLDIVHRSGRIVPQRSAGYEHIVALSLIGALHKNAPMNGPVIMDSPFGRLSKTHKENVIKALPKMAEQVVLLAYNGEIDAQTARLTLGSELKQEYRLDKISSFHTDIIPQ